ncbi:MAG: hypothetical protein F9K39_12780, partial [Exiguobacterium chiriqhucha]|uniref:hypothetical protein n=1 Tax=Exiguobacterium chiriqhucha TaxID=1385984 RepID=UPI00144EA4E8
MIDLHIWQHRSLAFHLGPRVCYDFYKYSENRRGTYIMVQQWTTHLNDQVIGQSKAIKLSTIALL